MTKFRLKLSNNGLVAVSNEAYLLHGLMQSNIEQQHYQCIQLTTAKPIRN